MAPYVLRTIPAFYYALNHALQTYFIMKFIPDFKPEMTILDIGFHLFPIHILLDLLGKTQTQPNVAGQLTKRYTGEVWEQIPICSNICNNLMIFLKGTITNSITTLKKITLNCNVPFS